MREDSKDRIYQLYNAGHSPMSAYHHFVEQLKATEANFVTAFADRKKMPRKSDFYKYELYHVNPFQTTYSLLLELKNFALFFFHTPS